MFKSRRPFLTRSITLLLGSSTMAMAYDTQVNGEFWGVGGGCLLLLLILLVLPERLTLKCCLLIVSPFVAFLLIDHFPGHPTLSSTEPHTFWFGLGSAIIPALMAIALMRISRRFRKKPAS